MDWLIQLNDKYDTAITLFNIFILAFLFVIADRIRKHRERILQPDPPAVEDKEEDTNSMSEMIEDAKRAIVESGEKRIMDAITLPIDHDTHWFMQEGDRPIREQWTPPKIPDYVYMAYARMPKEFTDKYVVEVLNDQMNLYHNIKCVIRNKTGNPDIAMEFAVSDHELAHGFMAPEEILYNMMMDCFRKLSKDHKTDEDLFEEIRREVYGIQNREDYVLVVSPSMFHRLMNLTSKMHNPFAKTELNDRSFMGIKVLIDHNIPDDDITFFLKPKMNIKWADELLPGGLRNSVHNSIS